MAVLHVDSGVRTGVYHGDLFPMASVVKLPVAIAVLAGADHGVFDLDSLVVLERRDLRSGAGPLAALYPEGGVRVSISALLDAMLIESDNTACDRLLELVGGPTAVNERMRRIGVPRLSVNRTEADLAFDWSGVIGRPAPDAWTPARIDSTIRAVPGPRRRAARLAFLKDPRDTASPFGMAWLLMRLKRGEVLSPTATSRLLDTMARCATGPARLPAGLPRGTRVARKTGTLGVSGRDPLIVNDVGLIALPEGRGHLAIAVFVKEWQGTTAEAEALIARLARAAYDAGLER